MKWSFSLLTALIAPVFSAPTPHTTPATVDHAQPHKRQSTTGLATWIWNTTMIQVPEEVTEFFTFAAQEGMQRAYLHIDADVENEVFESFISQCNSSGIAVEALMGNAEWIMGTGTPSLESNLAWITQYQGNASDEAKLSGIHMDIELWSLDNWNSLLDTYIPAWQAIATKVVSFGHALNLQVAADLPFWTYTMADPNTGETMDTWMLNALDAATFMTYRNDVTELLDVAALPLAAADAAGKPIYLAVETVAVAESPKVSFKGFSVKTLSLNLDDIAASASNHTSFAGIAVHDYTGWLAMK